MGTSLCCQGFSSWPIYHLRVIGVIEAAKSFGAASVHEQMYQGMHWPGVAHQMSPQFELIYNVKQVYETILDVQSGQ